MIRPLFPTNLLLILFAMAPGCTKSGTETGGADTAPIPTDSASGDSGTAGAVAPNISWSSAFDTTGSGALSGVWGSAPDDIFVVGGDPEQSTVYHFDGAAWTQQEAPPVPLLVWVFGFGPDDVYSVGEAGAFVHYDGESWTVLDSGTEEDLWGIWGRSDSDLWIVGGAIDSGDPVILHYDGEAVTPYELDPAENVRGAKSLFKVWGIGETTFIVGQRGQILQWDGAAWVNSSAGAEADDDFVSLWGTSEDHIVTVGGRSNGRIATWDGSAWTTTQLSGVPGLNAVRMEEPDEAVISGISGWSGTYNPETGDLWSDPILTTLDLHAIWSDGQGLFYAVGGRFYDPFEGIALVRTPED